MLLKCVFFYSPFFLTAQRVSRFTPRMSLHVDDAALALAPLAVERLVLGPYLHTAAPGAGVLVPDALERPEQLLAQQLLRDFIALARGLPERA